MKKFILTLTILTILGLALSLYYFYHSNPEESESREKRNLATWKVFTPRSQLFKVSFPHKPQYAKDFIAIPNSDEKRRYDMYASEKVDGSLFLINVITYPSEVNTDPAEEILRQNIDELMHNKPDNRLTHMEKSSFDNLHAFDFTIENSDFFVEGKAILDGHIVYMLTYTTRDDNFDPEEYQHFINSFHLLRKSQSSSPQPS